MISFVVLVLIGIFIFYYAVKATGHDTEIILGQKREVKKIGERIQEVLDTEKTEKKTQRVHRNIITEANKLVKSNRFKQAEKKYIDIIKDDHKNVKAYQGLGSLYLEQGEYEGAAEALSKVIEFEPTNDAALTSMGMALMQLKRYDEALTAYEHSVALDTHVPHRYINLALAAEKAGDLKRQVSALGHAVDLEPTNMGYLHALANAAIEIDNKSEAKKALEKIVEIEPANLEAHRKLARLDQKE